MKDVSAHDHRILAEARTTHTKGRLWSFTNLQELGPKNSRGYSTWTVSKNPGENDSDSYF